MGNEKSEASTKLVTKNTHACLPVGRQAEVIATHNPTVFTLFTAKLHLKKNIFFS
jgi:hypothetical protein